jgi:hypothetical protein
MMSRQRRSSLALALRSDALLHAMGLMGSIEASAGG